MIKMEDKLMLQLSREERYIALQGATNVRDIGGYETKSEYYTKAHRFIRSASTAKMTSSDCDKLYDYGVRHILDLRSDYEIEHLPSCFISDDRFHYQSINILESKTASVVPDDIMNYHDLSGFYIYIIEVHKAKIKEVFDVFAKHLYEGVLFHCSAGKDRTGVIAALLMDLAGCHEEDIIKDYSESYENNLAILDELEKMMEAEHSSVLGSSPTIMAAFLEYLREHYGSAKEYLISCGMQEEDIIDITQSFII